MRLSLNSPVQDIDLGKGYTTRFRNMCRACFVLNDTTPPETRRLETVGDLVKVPERDLRRYQVNVSNGTIDQLKKVLKRSGINLTV